MCIVQQAKDSLRKLKKEVEKNQLEHIEKRVQSLHKYCDILELFAQRKTFVAETRAYLDSLGDSLDIEA